MGESKQSKLGLAALITSVSAAVLFIFTALMAAMTIDAVSDSVLAVIGMFLILSITTAVAGVGLGIAGLYQKSCRKGFSISGVVCGGAVITLFILTWFIEVSVA